MNKLLVMALIATCVLGSLSKPAAAEHAATQPVKLVGMTIHGMPLGSVIDSLRDQTHENIFLNWRALKEQRVVMSLPVTVDLSGKTVPEALDSLLAEVGGDDARLGWMSDEGVYTVSTKTDLAKTTATQTYDVRKAIRSKATRDKDVAAVVARVRGIAPLSWRDAGGSIGAVRELSGQLIITQTPEVQARIAEELKDVIIQH
jgi:hypothetical protein